jgi:hypothetical protein
MIKDVDGNRSWTGSAASACSTSATRGLRSSKPVRSSRTNTSTRSLNVAVHEGYIELAEKSERHRALPRRPEEDLLRQQRSRGGRERD